MSVIMILSFKPYLVPMFVLISCFYLSLMLFIGESDFGSEAWIIVSLSKFTICPDLTRGQRCLRVSLVKHCNRLNSTIF